MTYLVRSLTGATLAETNDVHEALRLSREIRGGRNVVRACDGAILSITARDGEKRVAFTAAEKAAYRGTSAGPTAKTKARLAEWRAKRKAKPWLAPEDVSGGVSGARRQVDDEGSGLAPLGKGRQ